MLGQWIDGLTDEQRDRIVRAENWSDTGLFFDGQGNPVCVVSHAFDLHGYGDVGKLNGKEIEAGWRPYDALCHRFGLERTVRAIKLRAGADLENLEDPGYILGRDMGRVEPKNLSMEVVR